MRIAFFRLPVESLPPAAQSAINRALADLTIRRNDGAIVVAEHPNFLELAPGGDPQPVHLGVTQLTDDTYVYFFERDPGNRQPPASIREPDSALLIHWPLPRSS